MEVVVKVSLSKVDAQTGRTERHAMCLSQFLEERDLLAQELTERSRGLDYSLLNDEVEICQPHSLSGDSDNLRRHHDCKSSLSELFKKEVFKKEVGVSLIGDLLDKIDDMREEDG